ncbi:uncharacterized protein ARMOST_16063 [Armillaria ostoyae]|uniref:Uncharacterized protein n=1 Tax=Armillaria ostoyae TaxID=47428 RepID=A0A284RV47_ARMOS|nr:uncharacterized protein ARMOST_16063 [Armillaria ostoyae]
MTTLPRQKVPSSKDQDTLVDLPNDFLPVRTHGGRDSARKERWERLRVFVEKAKKTDFAFWSGVKDITDAKTPPPAVSLEDMVKELHDRINIPTDIPADFDLAGAANGATYARFLAIDNDKLLCLYNRCLDLQGAPRLWLISVLIGVLKPGKDASIPGNYRLIGLESCFPRVFTLLIDQRLQTWMQANGILPETQNGFRLGYHGLNNPFILRTVIDVALADGKALYVVFPDLANAFPWLNLSSLWSMMYRKGIAGPMFDWIRMLYGAMNYVVHLNGVMSGPFSSTIGLMTRDNGSPGFWNFFSSDLEFRAHEDDSESCYTGFGLSLFVAVSDGDSPTICHAVLPPVTASTACCHSRLRGAYSSGFFKGNIAPSTSAILFYTIILSLLGDGEGIAILDRKKIIDTNSEEEDEELDSDESSESERSESDDDDLDTLRSISKSGVSEQAASHVFHAVGVSVFKLVQFSKWSILVL